MNYVPKPILLAVLGLLVRPCMHNRVLMARLHRTYKYLAGLTDFDVDFLPNDVKNDLVFAGLLLPTAFIHIWGPNRSLGRNN